MYDLKKVIDKVYLLSIKDSYDLAMFFLRYQEFYESANDNFRGRRFTISDFMEWYSKDRNGYFSYPIDWAGFNIPSWVIEQVIGLGIEDKNKYDYEMFDLHCLLKKEVNNGDYYLIGVSGEDAQTIDHEVAHGMFFTIPAYKAEMEKLLKKLPKGVRVKINTHLQSLGYTKEVFDDEAQAYLATGFGEKFKKFAWKAASKDFAKVFNNFDQRKQLC